MFKRSTTFYGQTPEPETPYQKGRHRSGTNRIGSARRAAQKTGGYMAFGCLALLPLVLSGGVIWQAGHSTITPFVVEVDVLGEVRAVGPAIDAYRTQRCTDRIPSRTFHRKCPLNLNRSNCGAAELAACL